MHHKQNVQGTGNNEINTITTITGNDPFSILTRIVEELFKIMGLSVILVCK